MRTTVRIDDDLLRELKAQARRTEVSLTRLLNDVIRRGLASAASKPVKRRRPYRERVYNMGTPLIPLTKALAVAAAMEDEEWIKKMSLGK
jgi:hypothetical protein